MNDNAAYDARAVANLFLDRADELGLQISNLALQKLLYFAHGVYLQREKHALIDGYFEAWKHGPVHPQVYTAFKAYKAMPITGRATAMDYAAGRAIPLLSPTEASVIALADELLNTLGRLSASRLVALSHARRGPWDFIANEAGTDLGLGMRISDSVIQERFPRHKLTVGSPSSGDGPLEEAPFTE